MNANANNRHDHLPPARHFKAGFRIDSFKKIHQKSCRRILLRVIIKGDASSFVQLEPTRSENHQAGEQTAGRERIADSNCCLLR